MKFFQDIKMRWAVWVWNHTPNCAEMARLSSRSLEQRLTLKQHGQMWLHFLICAWCERYYKHLRFLHRAAPQYVERQDLISMQPLSAEARQRIKQRMKASAAEKL